MNINADTAVEIVVPRNVDVDGLVLRKFQGEADYPRMLAVVQGCAGRDGIERAEQLEDIVNTYSHLHHSDPNTDMLFAEVKGQVVGYCRTWWEVEGSGKWVGFQLGYVLPEWCHRGIGSTC